MKFADQIFESKILDLCMTHRFCPPVVLPKLLHNSHKIAWPGVFVVVSPF